MNKTIIVAILLLFINCNNLKHNKAFFFLKDIDGVSSMSEIFINQNKLSKVDEIKFDKAKLLYKISITVNDTFSFSKNDTLLINNPLTMGGGNKLYYLTRNDGDSFYLKRIISDSSKKVYNDKVGVDEINIKLSKAIYLIDSLWSK